jgi:hypothetical protein
VDTGLIHLFLGLIMCVKGISMDLSTRRNRLPAGHQKYASSGKMPDHHPRGRLLSFLYGLTDSELHRWFVASWLLLTGFRLLALAALALDLSGDEAYYWEWGRQLDWGYYSKPPGIAWLMALAGSIGGDTTFGIRLFAVALGSFGIWFLYTLGACFYGVRVGVAAAFLFALLPASAALNLVLTIDAPLMFFWTGALLAFWRFIESGGKSPAWGTALTLSLAGGLLSKQMMLVFYPLAVIFLILSPPRRALLKRPWLWAAFLASLSALIPALYWNSQNRWLTFRHTLHHFDSGDTILLPDISHFLDFIGASMGLITPVLWVLIMGLLLVSIFSWKHLGERERFLWLFSGPGMLVITMMSLRQRVHPNWPAVFLPAAVLFTTAWANGQWTPGKHLSGWQAAFKPAYKVAVLFFLLTYGAATAFSTGLIHAPEIDPLLRVRGWRQLASEIAASHHSLPNPVETLIITQSHRFTTSELAFYMPGHPRVYRYDDSPQEITSQHDLWETPAAHLGKDALIVVQGSQEQLSDELKTRFETVRFLEEIDHTVFYRRQYALFLGINLKSWPESGAMTPGASS